MARGEDFNYNEEEIREMKLYMVGDTPETDIIGGNANSFDTILLRTGNWNDGMESGNPTHIVNDVYDSVEKVIKLHGLI